MRRLAVIGAGKVALDHATAAQRLGARIVAANASSPASPRFKAFNAQFPTARYQSTVDMLADPEIEGLVVCASWHAMESLLPTLSRSPKPMLIEKPIGISSSDIAGALEGAVTANKMVGFNRRFYRPVHKLKERLSQGGLRSAAITVSENLDALVERWGRSILGHVPAYSSSHILDCAQHLLGVLELKALLRRPVKNYDPFDDVTALMETESGVPVSLSIQAFAPSVVGIMCHFEDGFAWHLGPMETLHVYSGYDIVEPGAEIPIRRYTPHVVDRDYVDTAFRPGFMEQMAAFVEGRYSCGATLEEGLSLMRFIEQISSAA